MNVIVVEFENGTRTLWQNKVKDTDVKSSKADAYEYYNHVGEQIAKVFVLPQS